LHCDATHDFAGSMASNFMNPSVASNAYRKCAADFVGRYYLKTLHNDGVPMKIMAEGNWMGPDLNQASQYAR
jgi:hypothetical protein